MLNKKRILIKKISCEANKRGGRSVSLYRGRKRGVGLEQKQVKMLFRVHRPALYHTAVIYLHSTAAAEDVLQEVFLALLEYEQPLRHPRAEYIRHAG